MSKKKIFSTIFLFVLIYLSLFLKYVYSFEYDNTLILENDLDIEQAYQNEEINYNMYTQLLAIYDNKIDINSADIYKLQLLPDFSSADASKIIEYRKKNGFFKNISGLVESGIIDESTYNKIKIFIIAEMPGEKTRGNVILKTKSNPYIETKTIDYPKNYDLLNLNVSKIKKYFKFGAIVEGDARYRNYFQFGDDLTGGNLEHGYRLNKAYLGYEDGPLVKQMYIGNFCANFGQGLTFGNFLNSSSNGLLPDQINSQEIQAVFYSSSSIGTEINDKYTYGYTRRHLRGMGSRIIINDFDLTGFYSQADYPAIRHFITNFGKSYYMKLEDIYSEKLLGSNLTYKISEQTPDIGETFIGTTLYTSEREPKKSTSINVPNWPPDESFFVYGANFVTGYKNFHFFGEITKVNNMGNAWYLKMDKDIGILNVIYSHLYSGADFFNPWSSLYEELGGETDYIEFALKLSQTMKTKFYFKQSEYIYKDENDIDVYYDNTYGTPAVDKKVYINYNWQLPDNINFQIDRKWDNNDIYSKGGMTVATSLQFRFNPTKFSGITIRYKYTEGNHDLPFQYIPKDEILGRISYDIIKNFEIASEIKFVDLDLNEFNREYRQYWIQVSGNIFKHAYLRSRFTNKWEIEELLQDGGSYTNRWELRFDYKW